MIAIAMSIIGFAICLVAAGCLAPSIWETPVEACTDRPTASYWPARERFDGHISSVMLSPAEGSMGTRHLLQLMQKGEGKQ